MPIQVLPDVLVARIAAGEVIERPAAVVKELVENALDAGATDIRVECADGGRRLLRITDNGCGIRPDEVELAFQHHATSKLTHFDDLDSIATLGFRGEALASIASVSQVACVTRHAEEASGTLIRLDNGKEVTRERLGRTAGTTMTIEHLFARVPARLKFLKGNSTERGHIDGVITRYALAYPQVRFALVHDGKVSFQSHGTGELRDVLVEVYGPEMAGQMVPVGRQGVPGTPGTPETGISVRGYAGLPTLSHSNRSKITLFVNGRPVQDTRLSYAVIQAYQTLLMTGRFPIAVILVNVPPDEVDVNVHPAKAEVRFRDTDSVFSAVQRAVRQALLANMAPPEPPSVFDRVVSGEFAGAAAFSAGANGPDDHSTAVIDPRATPAQPPLAGSERWERIGIARHIEDAPRAITPAQQAPLPAMGGVRQLPALRIIGQLASTYVLAEGPEGLYLIDQHAAHERVLFERLLAQHDRGGASSQALLDPVPVSVPADSVHLLEANIEVLAGLGFEIDNFGGNAFLVRAVPALMLQDDVVIALREIAADLEIGDAPMRREIEARVLRRVCKRMSIKAGRVLSFPEMQALVRDLEACDSPRTCPHGRPTIIQIGVGLLEKQFGRLG